MCPNAGVKRSNRVEAMPKTAEMGPPGTFVSKQAVDEAFKALSNWERWGEDDQIGTLNHVTPEDVIAAASWSSAADAALGIPLGNPGPQRGLLGKRWNPIHTMLATGTDAVAGRQEQLLCGDWPGHCRSEGEGGGGCGYIALLLSTATRCTTGITPSAIDSVGLSQLGIEHAKDKLVGRGVLLDIARFKGVDALHDSEGISNDDLDACAATQKVRASAKAISWCWCAPISEWKPATSAATGVASRRRFPGLDRRAIIGCTRRKWPASAPTRGAWRCGPTRRRTSTSPGAWVVICRAISLCIGKMFDLKALAEDCAKDKVYEFFFCGPLIHPRRHQLAHRIPRQ